MSHMVAVVALNIVNNGHGGDIVVKSAGLTASEEIVGDFDVNILGNPSKNIYDPIFTKKTNAKKSTKVELSSAVAIKYGESATLYLAVKPFDASGKELTISINGDAKKGNGASKTITMPAGSKFEAGKITTITVPVEKLSFHYEDVDPATSNVMDVLLQVHSKTSLTGNITLKEGNAVTTSNSSTVDVIINGKPTKAYVIGTESKVGSVLIHGRAKELINYIPMEFYAAAWDNKSVDQDKSVMRLEKITAHYKHWVTALLGYKVELSYSILTSLMDASKITFSGLVPLEQVSYNSKSHMIIMDEEPYHKPISVEKFESLLSNFDNNTKDEFVPTFEGLKAAIDNPGNIRSSYDLTSANLTDAEITAYTVWKKIDTKVSSSDALNFISGLLGDVMKSPKGLFEFVSNLPLDIELKTVAKGGEEGATDNRLIFWGLNSPEAN